MHSLKKSYKYILSCFIAVLVATMTPLDYATATENPTFDKCIQESIERSPPDTTIKQLKETCELQSRKNTGLISKRIYAEKRTLYEPYVITPHKLNYILPVITTNNINKDAYAEVGNWASNLEDVEAKFQLSIKLPLNYQSMFIQGDELFFGFTIQSWWQVYSNNISKPFRETNYQPELFYMAPLNWHPAGGNTGFSLGIEHQSNGRSSVLSRSWNRIYFNLLYEKNDFALSIKPWVRIPEDEKNNNLSDDGDDNPDISDYMGHFELGLLYRWRDYEFALKGRENFETHNGAYEFNLTFPLWGNLRGYAQYTEGYGESLIDYNHSQKRFGLGIALTNIL